MIDVKQLKNISMISRDALIGGHFSACFRVAARTVHGRPSLRIALAPAAA